MCLGNGWIRAAARVVAPCVLVAIVSAPAWAVCDHDAAAVTSAEDRLGALTFPTSTRSPEAQRTFERGLLQLHLYHYPEAEVTFRAAQALDPGFAMAYWGEAMTATWPIWNADFPARAHAALAKLGTSAEARAAKAGSAREKAYLAAVETLFGPGTLAERDAGYLKAMKALAATYPDDDEAQLFHAQALLGVTRGERNIPNYLAAAAIAERVFRRNPDHPGASHYWIHGMDDPGHARGALEAAYALSKVAPGAAHAQHMASHIFFGLGMWDQASAANERARDAVTRQQQHQQLPVLACFHAVEWLHYGYYQQGRHREAQGILDACLRDGRQALTWYRAHPDRVSGFARTPEAFEQRLEASLSTMRATALIESTYANAANAELVVGTASLGRYAAWDAFARGWAAARSGNLPLARAELVHLRTIAQEPADAEEIDHIEDYFAIMGGMLDAAIAARSGDDARALATVQRVAASYHALPFDFGPPLPVKPPSEYAGELLLAAGDPKAALVAFERALELAPRRALSLLGRLRALKALGKRAAAEEARGELAEIWHAADADLPGLEEVRASLGARRESAAHDETVPASNGTYLGGESIQIVIPAKAGI